MLYHISTSFSKLNIMTLLCGHSTCCLYIHQLSGTGVVFTLGLFWIMLQYTFMYKFLCEYMLSVFLGNICKKHVYIWKITVRQNAQSNWDTYSVMVRPAPEPCSQSYPPNLKVHANNKYTSSKVRDQDMNWFETSHEETVNEEELSCREKRRPREGDDNNWPIIWFWTDGKGIILLNPPGLRISTSGNCKWTGKVAWGNIWMETQRRDIIEGFWKLDWA